MFDVGLGVVAGEVVAHVGHGGGWREIDRRMRQLAKRRAELDAEEASLLIDVKRAEVYKHLGYGSMMEYLERICGFSPRTARERLRVAEALESLPVTRQALADGELSFSAVRELTRSGVVTAETEDDWLAAMHGCTVREIEDNVRGHAPGDLPTDRPDPDLEPRTLRIELPPHAYALFLEARRHLEKVTGDAMTDADFMAVACRSVLAGSAPAGNDPPHQIAISICATCKRGWQETGRTSVELAPADIDRMRCDAVELGRVDGDHPDERVRTIPAPIRRAVLVRDHNRCTVPGCRSSTYVDVHHITYWSHGGDHAMQNLTTLCSLHHDLLHHGLLLLSGTANHLVITHADGRPYGTPPAIALPADPSPSAAHVGRAAPPPIQSISDLPPTAAHVGRAAAQTIAMYVDVLPPGPDVVRLNTSTSQRRTATSRVEHDARLATMAAEVRTVLTRLGFRPAEAAAAVERAVSVIDGEVSLEQLIRAALLECPRPRSA
jgi:hypothetical protein